MRGFKKISKEQIKKDFDIPIKEEDIKLPIRSTKKSAGYDIFSPITFELQPGEIKSIPTGIKSYMKEDEFLMIVLRSSLGFKFNLRLTNQVGIIDSDYYDNKSNEGHIHVSLQNLGNSKYTVEKGDRIVQGIFMKYYTVDSEFIDKERTSGFGSTGK